jgi:hypothetical protein
MIYTNEQGKKIGELKGGIFKKSVSKKKHLFRKGNSWAIQESVLKELEDDVVIEIFDRDEKITYRSTVKNFKANCQYYSFEDYGLQGYLPLQYWTTQKATASVLVKPEWV